MFAKFDEIPAMILQDVKETKHYRRTHARMYGQRENSIPTTNKVCGGINSLMGIWWLGFIICYAVLDVFFEFCV